MSKTSEDLITQTVACLRMMGKSQAEIGQVVGRHYSAVRKHEALAEASGMTEELAKEVKKQVFDPVKERLEAVSKDAIEELWQMREEVESERLRKDILLDVLHMAGYRPHTSVDKQTEDLPTIMVGKMNVGIGFGIGNPGGENDDPEAISTNMEVQNGGVISRREETEEAEFSEQQRAETQDVETFIFKTENNDSGNERESGWASSKIERGESDASGKSSGDTREE